MKNSKYLKIARLCVRCVGVAYFGFLGLQLGWCQNPLVSTQEVIQQGFEHAWKHNFRRAGIAFHQVLQQDSDNKEAIKGLAYLELYKGNGKKAAIQFYKLQLQYPDETEFQFAHAMALLQQNRVSDAQKPLQEITRKYPHHMEARKLLSRLALQPAFIEVEVWAGFTRWKGLHSTGLRMAQFSLQPNTKTRLWLRYDNAMSLDNANIASNHLRASAIFAGGLYNFRPSWLSRLEIGERFLGNGVRQHLLQGEQMVHLGELVSLKAGGLLGRQQDRKREYMFFVGTEAHLSASYTIELICYHTFFRPENYDEQRWLANAHIDLPRQHKLTIGGFLGNRLNPAQNDRSWGVHTMFTLKLNSNYNLGLLARFESSPIDQFMVLSTGLSRKFHR